MSSSTDQDGNGNHSTHEEKVKKDREESKELDTSKEACKEDSKGGVNDGSTAKTLDSLDLVADVQVMVIQLRDEVRVEGNNGGSAEEVEEVEECCHRAQQPTDDFGHFG